ncbi:Crp/Fnr family transcriptional regulator [Sphingobacterium lactis]|uniref:Crp/Fnr family transcriptional regulator n=1 Tax=Sphingobacterium lactis TaxID=797291 RepID=UPI003F8153F9
MISEKFDFLLEAGLREEFEQAGQLMQIPAGQLVVEPQKYIKVIPFLLKGSMKVIRQDEDGHELFIYYIRSGETCAVSLSTLLMDKLASIKAITEDDVELIAIPSSLARRWYDMYPSWRMFVLRTMDQRFEEVINTLDKVAFKKIDERLLDYLTEKTKITGSKSLNMTHQEIANELSTSREVISRLLKLFEQRGILKLFRNKIEIN